METFIIDIVKNEESNTYVAMLSTGSDIVLNATNYHDAVCEADLINLEN